MWGAWDVVDTREVPHEYGPEIYTGKRKQNCIEDDKENQRHTNYIKCFSYIKCFNIRWKVATNWLLTESGY